jgi:hypothetical protein
MSVMDKYVPITHTQDERRVVPVPASAGLGQLPSLELFEGLPASLGLPEIGVYTPWATRTGDMTWEPGSESPNTNIMVWGLTDQQVNLAQEVGFGNPLPFVVIMTEQPLTNGTIDAMWGGTAYAPYETQAIFRQDDAKPVPTIRFLHWGERIDMANAPQHLRPLEAAAQSQNGQLSFAAQIEARESTQRDFPALPFDDALTAQLALTPRAPVPGLPASQQAPYPQQIEVIAEAPSQRSAAMPILVGIGSAVLTYWIVTRKDKR